MHGSRLVSFHEMNLVSKAVEQLRQLFITEAAKHRRICDFVTIQMKNGKNGSVPGRVREFVGMPARCQWTGLGFPIANDAAGEQVRVIENRAVRVNQRIAEFSALMNRARGLGRSVTGYSPRKGKLFEELP